MAINPELIKKTRSKIESMKAIEKAPPKSAKTAPTVQTKSGGTTSDFREALEEKKLLHKQNPVVPTTAAPVSSITVDFANKPDLSKLPQAKSDSAIQINEPIPEQPDAKGKDWLSMIGQSAAAGLNTAAKGIAKADELATRNSFNNEPILSKALRELILPDLDDKAIKFKQDIVKQFEGEEQYYQEKANEGATPAQQFVGGGVQAVSAMVPQIVLSLMTGGAAPAATSLAEITPSAVPGLSTASVSNFGNRMKEMIPFMTQAAGGYARDAELKGATPEQQTAYGITGGLSEGLTEMIPMGALKKALGVGDDVAKTMVKKGAKNLVQQFGKKGLQWVVNAGEQMFQEAAVDPLTGGAEKAFVDNNKPFVGNNGVIDFSQMGQDAKGALAMSLVMTALGLPANAVSHIMAQNAVGKTPTEKDIQDLYDAVVNDLKNQGNPEVAAQAEAAPTVMPQQEVNPEASQTAQNIYGSKALEGLEKGKLDILGLAKNKPDTEVDRKQYETYREYIKDALPGISDKQVDAAINELRQMEIDSPPAKGDTTRRLDYIIDKIRPEVKTTAQQKTETAPSVAEQATSKPGPEPRTVEDRIKSLENARNNVKPGSRAYDDLTKKIEALQGKVGVKTAKEDKPALTPGYIDGLLNGTIEVPEITKENTTRDEYFKKEAEGSLSHYEVDKLLGNKPLYEPESKTDASEIGNKPVTAQPTAKPTEPTPGKVVTPENGTNENKSNTGTPEIGIGSKLNLKGFGDVEVTGDKGATWVLENSKGNELQLGKKVLPNLITSNAKPGQVTAEPAKAEQATKPAPASAPTVLEQVNTPATQENDSTSSQKGQKTSDTQNTKATTTPISDHSLSQSEIDTLLNLPIEPERVSTAKGKQLRQQLRMLDKDIDKQRAIKDELSERKYFGEDIDEAKLEAETAKFDELVKLREKLLSDIKAEENPADTKQENGGIIGSKGGTQNGENAVSSDKNRADVHEASENISSEGVPEPADKGRTGEARLPNAGGSEGGNGKPDAGVEPEPGSGLGDNSAENSDTSGVRAGEQHTGDRPGNVQVKQSSNPKGSDYVINSQEDSIIDNGKKTRYKSNVAAIKLMKQLEAEGRPATAEEQKVLSKYVGWGGIPEVFSTDPSYNRETRQYESKPKKDWESEYNELKELLTEEEYRQANDTILNAHYTAINVIKAMYNGLEHFGFAGGRVIEPAVGIGNFIGSMPANMRSNVKVMTGIEIDTITGKIAKLLYPNADIRVQGFEKAKLPTGYYDVAISNVPFGKVTINDNKYPNSITRSIHNYFFAKTLDVVRPGGIIMFITSSKTMDSKDTSGIRAYIKSRADLIGAIRLPNTAFKENAMTEVTTDIVILKVRGPNTDYKGESFSNMAPTEVEADWGKTSHDINEYFVNHPENVLGELRYGSNMYAGAEVYVKGDGRDLGKAVIEALNKMQSGIYAAAKNTVETTEKEPKTIRESSRGAKEGTYEVVNGKLAINRDGKLVEVEKNASKDDIKRITKLIELKNSARSLLDAERNNSPESVIKGFRKQLNTQYDAFIKENGYINRPENTRLIADDPDVSFLLSLEEYTKPRKENKSAGIAAVKEQVKKGQIFTENTVAPAKKVDKVETAKESLIVSLNEKGSVDINRMSELTDKDEPELVKELAGHIYKNPVSQRYETADEYLSGNVKAKLREAEGYAANEPAYNANVEALKSVQPADKEAWQISLKLGSSLIGEDIYEDFARHLFGSGANVDVKQMRHSGEWSVKEGKTSRYNSVKNSTSNTVRWGLNRPGFRGLDLLEKVMNNRSIIVNETYTDDNGSKIKVNNPEATALAQERAEKMKEEFITWLNDHNNGETIKKVVQNYNDVYNTDVLRVFDGSHLPDTLEGMNPSIKLASHQKDAIWRIISSGRSTLLAHEVGAGKTFEMIAAAMEMKRLGIINKPMFCVPNNVYEQWGIEFRRLYPGAKILLPTKEEMEQKNRRVFMNRIATGSYDGIIVPESQFSMLPMSEETVREFYEERIREMETALEIEIAENGKGSSSEKKITLALKNLRTKMEKKISKIAQDRGNIDFEELGIDALFVDEAHRFKNLMYTTRLQVSGLGNPEGSDKAFDLLMKTRYLQNLNNGRGVVFATATPLLNSIAEVYNWQQYMCPEQLHSRGVFSFDAWASIFAKIENIAEVKPEGSGYRVKSGVSKITNVGQLAKMFREFTDFRTQEMLRLPRPDVKGGKYEVISIPGTDWLKGYMEDLAGRAEAVRSGHVDPSEDNMLKITTDGRKAALYPGLVDSSFELGEGEHTKIDVAADHLYEQWKKTKDDRLTHLVFLEFSTPKAEKDTTKSKKQTDVEEQDTGEVDNALDSVYQEFKRKLVAKGIPAKEIAFIHDAKNSEQKINLKNRFNNGEVRILIGNNEKMGVGIDLQRRTKTITHIDFPWRPKDLQQEDGRGLRQGNMNKEIEMYVLVTEGSFDARLWDNLQRKSKLVDDMLTSDLDAVEIEDVGVQTLSAQEVVGIASGNPLMQEQIIVSQKVMKMRALEKGYRRDKAENQRRLAYLESSLASQKEQLKNLNRMAEAIKDTTADKFEVTIEGKRFTERKEAEAYLDQLENKNRDTIKKERVFEFKIDFAGVINRGKFTVKSYNSDGLITIDEVFYADEYEYAKSGTLQGLETSLRNIRNHLTTLESSIKNDEKEIVQLKKELEKEFPHTEELRKLTLREQELMRILNPEQVLNVAVETEDEGNSDEGEQGFTGASTVEMPRGDNSSTSSKTVDDLIEIIEKHTGVPIRTGKYRKKALGIFKIKPEVIRTKVRGDMPVISHELGHYLDKKFKFSESNQFKNELLVLGAATSKPSYEPKQIRAEGVAEFVRLYLTNPISANAKAPLFLAHFEKMLDADTLGFLGMLRREISAIKNLPNNKKIWNDISAGENRKSTIGAAHRDNKVRRVMSHIYDAWINDQGIFAKMESYAEGKGWSGKDIDLLTQVYKGFEAKALHMLFDKQRNLDNEIIGDSLMEILDELSPKKVKARKGNAIQERKDFITYMVSRRAADYKDRGLVMPQPWYVYEDNAIAMEEKYPHFTKIFDGLREWEDNNLQLLVDSGIKTDADIEMIKYMNANHVPLYRIKEAAEAIRAGSGNTLGQSKNVIKRATGSGATIIDPLESMITDAFIIRRAAESNNIMRVLYEMSSDVEGIGSMVEKVPPGGTKTSFTVKEIRKQMLKAANDEADAIKREAESEEQKKDLKRAEDYKKSIEDLSDEQLESVMSVYRPLFREKDNEVTVYVDGQKKLLQVDPELYKAIKGLNREQMNIIMKALNAVKKVKQAGVVTTVPFVLRNLMRDTGTSLIQSEAGINPVDIMMGYRSAIAKDEWYKEWVASGGATEYVNINERRQAQKLEDDVLQYGVTDKARLFLEALGEVKANNNERTRGKLLNAAQNMLDIPVDMIRDAVEWSEAGARIAEFRKAVEKGVDKQTAAAWSRKLSVDFLRHGYTGKQVNMIVAFFNANVQGVVRIGETFKAHPAKTMARGLIYVTLPTMLLYFINRDDDDYRNLPAWRKAMFWNIPIGGGKFITIPKPPGWGWLFGTLPEITVDKILTDNPDYLKDMKDTFWESFQFPTEVSAVSPIIDVYADKQWNGSPVEGQYARENTPAYMIRDERTSLLSSMIGDIAKNEKGLSPKQLDYLVKQYLGSVGDFFWRLPDTIKAGIEAPSDITQYPVIKSFITDAAYSSDCINDLYDIGKELSLRRKELLDTGEYTAMSHLPKEQQKKLFASLEAARSEYNKLADDFTDARKTIKQIKESDKYGPAEKKMRERALLQKMNKAAAAFDEKYRSFKKKYNIK